MTFTSRSWLLSLILCAACDPDPGGSGGSGGSAAAVACVDAQDGDPCDSPGDMCGAEDGYGCSKFCNETTWSVSCTEQPACPEEPPASAGPCDAEYGPTPCGPYEVETECGIESISAECTILGWVYPTECAPDCSVALDAESCGAILDCVWIKPCEGEFEPRCASLASPLDQGGIANQICDQIECPVGSSCLSFAINQDAPPSGNCEGTGSAWVTCEPVPTP